MDIASDIVRLDNATDNSYPQHLQFLYCGGTTLSTANHDHRIYVLMGVSGSGKSAATSEVMHQLHTTFLNDDFLHPYRNTEKITSDEPLNDDDHKLQLQALNDAAFTIQCINKVSLIVCSALEKHYYDLLREDNPNLSFIYLRGNFGVIENRLRARKGHFFRTQMLAIRSETLQEPGAGEIDVLMVDVDQLLEGIMASTIGVTKESK